MSTLHQLIWDRRITLLCLGFLFLANPVLYFLDKTLSNLHPDTFAYLTLARDLFSSGQLYISGWGHVDRGLILPPLYSILIASGGLMTPDLWSIAHIISDICILITAVPIFLLLKPSTGTFTALLTTLALPINAVYFRMALTPLTEALFVLLLSCSLLLFKTCLFRPHNKGLDFAAGLLFGLAFLARQVGLFVLTFFIVWIALMSIIEDRFQWTTATRRIGMSLCGFLLIVLPNSITLFIQTGHGPLTQYFRMGTYTVTVDDPEILENIEKIKRGEVKEYRDIYEQRRQLFRLLPDASEMYSSILSKKNSRPGIWEKIKKNLLDPKAYLLRLKKNFLHIKYAIGDPLFFVFLAMMLTPFLVRRSRTEFPKRYSIGGFVLFYILAISTLSDLVPRYVEVLLPFVLIHTACELYVIATNLFHRYGHRTADILCGVAVLLLVLLSTPSYFTQLTLHQRIPEHAMLRVTLQNSLRSNHGIFSLHPAWSYLLGGKWRVLPNDRFEKVVEYARRTGVNWLLVSKTANDVGEIRLYTEAQWYENPYLPFRYPELVEYYGGDQRGQFRLYRILNHEDLS